MAETAVSPALGSAAERMVGRVPELGVLEQLLAELDQGRPAGLALLGEPGIGKSRLLAELADRAESRGHLVLYGSASELERDLPFSVFIDALGDYLESLDSRLFAALDQDAGAELGRVFPSLSGLGGARELALQQERYRTHRAVRSLLEHLARDQALVLALDDVHWADAASVELLGALLRRPPGAAVLLALGLRPPRVSSRLQRTLERAELAGTVTRLELGVLTAGEARELLGETVGSVEATALYAESGGNPLYLQQLARSLVAASPAAQGVEISFGGIEIPSIVAASLGEELHRLSDRARHLLNGAAVAGDPFEFDLAAEAAATSGSLALDALDELLEHGLIRQTDVPRRFRFRHPLVRRVVYETTRSGWRLGAHERCARRLEAQGASAAARAHHIERCAQPGDATAVATLREAGVEVARLAPASAAQWFGSALRLLPPTTPGAERLSLHLARADSLTAAGRYAESRADLVDCVAIAARCAPEWSIRVTTACAAVEHLLGLHAEAHRHLSTALADVSDADSADAAALMVELSVDRLHAGDRAAALAWAERAVSAARPMDEPALLAAAMAVRAWASAASGSADMAQQYCDEATELVDGLTDEVLAPRLDALASLASADLFLDRFSAATRHARRALGIARATGRGDLLPAVVAMLGGSLWMQGKAREAEELFDGAVEAARLTGDAQRLGWMLFNRSIAALVAGELEVAMAAAEESVELEDGLAPGLLSATAGAVLGAVLLEAGQPERSIEVMLSRCGGEGLPLIAGGWRARFLETLTRAMIATGDRSGARRAVAQASGCAETVGLPSASALASLAAAAVLLDQGDPTTAAGRAIAAAEAFESVAAAWDAARARAIAGRALVQAGERDRGIHELECAAGAFDAFGSLRYRNQAERELRKLGRHPYRRTRRGRSNGFGIESLTQRELEVARLVVDRKTNPEIAAELFLSQKTVESHLRNIFNKTGVATRIALARLVERATQPRLEDI